MSATQPKERRHVQRGLTTAAALTLGACTANFWRLRSGVLGGETEGAVETSLVRTEGCNDLTVYAINEDATALLTLTMTGPLAQMHDDKDRLKTLTFEDEADFSLVFQTGRDLQSLPCDGEYRDHYGYYGGYYGYEGEDEDEDEGEGEGDRGSQVQREFAHASGDLRLSLTARKRRWDFDSDPVHAKLWLDDVVLMDPANGETVTIPSALLQTYIWQWYWY